MHGRTGPRDSHPAPSHVLQLETAFTSHTFSWVLGSLLGALFLLHAGLGGVHSSFSLLGNFLASTAQLPPVFPNARICLQLLSQISDIAPESHRPSFQERSADPFISTCYLPPAKPPLPLLLKSQLRLSVSLCSLVAHIHSGTPFLLPCPLLSDT